MSNGNGLKRFTQEQVKEALAYAAAGGQALHTHRIIVNWQKAPACFKREVNAGRDIAHLFDQDASRLQRTAAALGVKFIVIERYAQPGQHIDLCGGPLRKALSLCERPVDTGLFDVAGSGQETAEFPCGRSEEAGAQ